MSKHSVEEIKAVILGHAVGDALGVPVEFQTREGLEADPVTDMRGYGTYPVPVGSWSDDTSMTLCALDAMAQKSFLWDAVMVNFGRWYYKDEFTPTGKMFDIGTTCRLAIDDFFLNQIDIDHCGRRDERSNGNGSLMRIIPFVLYAPNDLAFIEKASCLTHAHRRSQIACGVYVKTVKKYLETESLHQYRFSTILWYRLRADLHKQRRHTWKEEAQSSLDDFLEVVGEPDDSGTSILWSDIEQQITEQQIELLRLRAMGFKPREIARMQQCSSNAIHCRFKRIKKKLKRAGLV